MNISYSTMYGTTGKSMSTNASVQNAPSAFISNKSEISVVSVVSSRSIRLRSFIYLQIFQQQLQQQPNKNCNWLLDIMTSHFEFTWQSNNNELCQNVPASLSPTKMIAIDHEHHQTIRANKDQTPHCPSTKPARTETKRWRWYYC